jgi:N-methylhydantoinase A/oxoprolinase/acetone carboxylase beta subunit
MRALEREVRRAFDRPGRLGMTRTALARYVGQSHELELDFGPDLAARFHQAHGRRYGFARQDAVVEVVTLEAEGERPVGDVPGHASPARGRGVAERRARATVGGRAREVDVWRFESLSPQRAVKGPAIVLQSGATLWVEEGWTGRRHASGALLLARGRRT